MTLFNKGSDKLNSEFKAILDKYNRFIKAVDLLNIINNDEGMLSYLLIFISLRILLSILFKDTSNEDVPNLQPLIPEQAKQTLIKIANWLLDNERDEYLTVYGKVRGSVLQNSLNSLRKHQRSVSGGSTHGMNGSPMLACF